jgi:hypothetical protein
MLDRQSWRLHKMRTCLHALAGLSSQCEGPFQKRFPGSGLAATGSSRLVLDVLFGMARGSFSHLATTGPLQSLAVHGKGGFKCLHSV